MLKTAGATGGRAWLYALEALVEKPGMDDHI